MAQTSDTPAPKQVVAAGYDRVADAYTRLEDASWPRMRWLAKLLAVLPPTRQSWTSAAATATRSWLKPGGFLLLGTEAVENAGTVGTWLDVPMFFSSFDAETVLHLIRAAGLAVDDTAVEPQVEGGHQIHYLWMLARSA